MDELPIDVYQVKQIRELELIAINNFVICENELMERAGIAAFKTFQYFFPTVTEIAVLCGKGNNGGDGYVFASKAHQAGMNVIVYSVGNTSDLPRAAQKAYQDCLQTGVTITPFNFEIDFEEVDVVIDALLGIGVKNEVRDDIKKIIQHINQTNCEVLSIDIPSGLDADTGSALGEAIIASVTVTFIGLKQGLLTADGLACAGELICDDLQLPAALFEKMKAAAYRLTWNDCQHWFLPRSRNVHKGDFGHVLIVGGDYGMAGAVSMVGEAALRVGAGLVTVATRPSHVAAIVARSPEIICYGIDEASELSILIEKASVIVVGPGLGFSAWSHALWQAVLTSDLPLIVDASALHLLANKPLKRDNWILTPHPGEAATLLNKKSHEIQQNRFQASQELQQRYSGVIVLKGAGTIIQKENDIPRVCNGGNPGMASAGMGDVLSGILAGLIAQHYDLSTAAELGVCLHAQAGDVAAENGERGLLARDLIAEIRGLVNMI